MTPNSHTPYGIRSPLATSRQRRLATLAAGTARDPKWRLCALFVFLVFLAALMAALSGCASAPSAKAPVPTVLVAPESEAARARESALAAHVAQAREDNAGAPPSLPREAASLQLATAALALPPPTPEDAARAAQLSHAVYTEGAEGRNAAATTAAQAAQTRIRALTAAHEREREERTLALNRTISDFNAALTAAQNEANRQAQLRISTLFALLGAAVTLGGIISAVTGWSRVGVALIPAGVSLAGSGLLWGKAWFLYTVGGALALCCVAVGLLWAVSVSRSRKQIL